jgi:hypothetical protein
VTEFCKLSLSVTVSLTGKSPARVKICSTILPVASTVPSPSKSHSYLTIWPSLSVDAEASNDDSLADFRLRRREREVGYGGKEHRARHFIGAKVYGDGLARLHGDRLGERRRRLISLGSVVRSSVTV